MHGTRVEVSAAMRWVCLVAILGGGCLQQLVPEHKKAEAQAPMPDLADTPAEDLAEEQQPGDLGLLGFGATCTVGAECATGLCEATNNGLHCTVACTMLGQADPACPMSGQCNQKGFCK